ncbi:UPF0764 protein C16orf89 homolog [Rhinoderma darwinii]|uniref:UPF0764 protein C16orf89 homolog n=1 Tax=Rhinoderma darwinii TaxID=43563 RepID=UPI003F674614
MSSRTGSSLSMVMLCGLCGYSDFYKLEWMNQIISWQDPIIGCFGDIGHNLNSENAANKNRTPRRVKRENVFSSEIGNILRSDWCLFIPGISTTIDVSISERY